MRDVLFRDGGGECFVEQTVSHSSVKGARGMALKRNIFFFFSKRAVGNANVQEQQKRFIVVPDEECTEPASSDMRPRRRQMVFIKPLVLLCIYVQLSAGP